MHNMPGVVLSFTQFFLLIWMPANSCRIKKHLRSLQRSQPRAFGIPLVPANQGSYSAHLRIKRLETEVARSEVILFVIKRIVRNVHLAVHAAQASVCVKHYRGIVINPRRALLK